MKKLLTILVLIMLIISFFQITSMYALYKEQVQAEYNTLLGAWKIKVNETDVTTGEQVETFTISDSQLGYISSSSIQAGKIAPNGQAYFDIIIDPSNTDVSIVYTVNIDTKALSSTNADIQLTDAIELISCENYFGQGEDGQTNKIENDVSNRDGNTYTSVIPLDKITQGYKNYIRFYFRWNNVTENIVVDETETVVESNNEQDSTLGKTENAKLTIPLQMNLKQYTGEVIGNVS